MRIEPATETALAYVAANVPAFLWGAPGVGKSDLARTLAAKLGLPLFDVRATLLDPVDLRGIPHVKDGRTQWAPPAFLPDDPALLFLDELNAAHPQVQTACYQLVLDRRVGEFFLPDGVRILAAGNRQSDRAAARSMPSALANRFAHIDIDPDAESWAQWALASGLPPEMAAFIRFRPNLLHIMTGPDLREFPSPRAWASVAAALPHATDATRFAIVRGLVGEGAAAEFLGYLDVWHAMPKLADILADPSSAPVPVAPGILFAVSTALARKADKSTMAAVATYADRLPPEYGALLMTDATARDATLCETQAFVSWAIRHGRELGAAA